MRAPDPDIETQTNIAYHLFLIALAVTLLFALLAWAFGGFAETNAAAIAVVAAGIVLTAVLAFVAIHRAGDRAPSYRPFPGRRMGVAIMVCAFLLSFVWWRSREPEMHAIPAALLAVIFSFALTGIAGLVLALAHNVVVRRRPRAIAPSPPAPVQTAPRA